MASSELAHDIAVHIAFGRPKYLRREDVPAEEVEAERTTLETESRREGKPEAALPKIIEGKLSGWFKRVPGGVLLEQPYARDDKRNVAQVLGKRRDRAVRPGRDRRLMGRPGAPWKRVVLKILRGGLGE